jgi:hypothetical protein
MGWWRRLESTFGRIFSGMCFGDWRGLHLLCLEYAAFQKFAPKEDIGFDLSAEYQAAGKMFKEK